MAECCGLAGRLFGHDYRPRYSVGVPAYVPGGGEGAWGVFSSDIAGIVAASRPRTYHGDVCLRCGHVLPLPSSQPEPPP